MASWLALRLQFYFIFPAGNMARELLPSSQDGISPPSTGFDSHPSANKPTESVWK